MGDTAPADISGVPATMLVTVSARALAPSAAPQMEFRDRHAEAIVDRLGIDPAAYCTFMPSLLLTIFRSKYLDTVTTAFVERHPDGVVVNLACGLSTSYERVEASMPSTCTWVDIDLPEVIAIRRRLFPDTERRRMRSGDVTRPSELAEVIEERRPMLVVMEGLLFYLADDDVETLFRTIARGRERGAQPTEVVFDFVSTTGRALSEANTDLRRTNTEFRWAYEGLDQLHDWDPGLQLLQLVHNGEHVPDAVRPMFEEALARDGLPPAGVIHLARRG